MFEQYETLLSRAGPPPRTRARHLPDPLAVGAVGGSGTRLVAAMLSRAGVAMAAPINPAGDAVEWPPLRRLLAGRSGQVRQDMLISALGVFEDLLLQRRADLGMTGRVGWKVPGTFYWLRELDAFFPELQYVHIMRNGLDMAYSRNQRQVKKWAGDYGLELTYGDNGRVHPAVVLDYWLAANEAALAAARECLDDRFLLMRFEDICTSPRDSAALLCDFVGLEPDSAGLDSLVSLVDPPASIGRYRDHDWRSHFSEAQLSRLEALGYSP